MTSEPWHDPTHGQIDRDIQEHVEKMQPSSVGQRAAIERTLQDRRNRGVVVLGQVQEPRQPEPGAWPTPQQWVWMLEDASPDRRLEIARSVLSQAQIAATCLDQDHVARIAELKSRLAETLEQLQRYRSEHESNWTHGQLQRAGVSEEDLEKAAAATAILAAQDGGTALLMVEVEPPA